MRFCNTLLQKVLESEPQPKADATARLTDSTPSRHSTIQKVVAPATATDYAVRPTIGACRIGLSSATVRAIPVATPFPQVATHIVNAQLVGRLGGYGVSLVTAIVVIPSHITNLVAATVFVALAHVTTPSSIFPFCFSGQAEVFAGEGIQFGDKLLAIVPRHLLYR